MKRRYLLLIGGLVLVAGLAGSMAAQDEEGPQSSVKFVVVRESSGKPVKNAAVVMHPVNRKGKQERGGMELKTDTEGKTGFDGIPYGPLRVQVLAHGYQTFGEDYNINKPEMEIKITLKRPQEQYSVYDDHAEPKKEPEQKKPEQKPQD